MSVMKICMLISCSRGEILLSVGIAKHGSFQLKLIFFYIMTSQGPKILELIYR